MGQIQEKCPDSLLGRLLAQQHLNLLVFANFAAQQAVHVGLQVVYPTGQHLDLIVGYFADGSGLEGLGGAHMAHAVDGIEAEDFTRQIEADDVFLAFLIDAVSLDGPGPYRVERGKRIAGLENDLVTVERLGPLDGLVHLIHFFDGEGIGQTQRVETAFLAGDCKLRSAVVHQAVAGHDLFVPPHFGPPILSAVYHIR